MKLVVALFALTAALTACGGSETATEAPTTEAPATTAATTTAAPTTTTTTEPPTTTTVAPTTTATPTTIQVFAWEERWARAARDTIRGFSSAEIAAGCADPEAVEASAFAALVEDPETWAQAIENFRIDDTPANAARLVEIYVEEVLKMCG